MGKVSLQSRFPSYTLRHSWTLHEGREGLCLRAEHVLKEGPGCSSSLTTCTLLRREVWRGICYTLLLVNLGVATMQENCKVEWKVVK